MYHKIFSAALVKMEARVGGMCGGEFLSLDALP